MAEQGIHIIGKLRRRYVAFHVLADVLLAGTITLTIAALLYWLALSYFWLIVLYPLTLFCLLALHCPWKMGNHQIAAFLDKQFPEMQESTALILVPAEELNILQTLALNRAEETISHLRISYKYFTKALLRALFLLTVANVLFAGVHVIHKGKAAEATTVGSSGKQLPPEKILPQIESIGIDVTPPGYTGKPKRTQDRFNLSVEEGALVQWNVTTNINIKSAFVLFNDKERIPLKSTDGKQWQAQKQISSPGFYQVSIDGKLSDLYQVQIVKDAPPVVHIKAPKPATYIDAGEPQQVNITASLTDDYGVADAQIIATVAKGRGEGVKFKEYKLTFNTGFGGHSPQYNVQKLIGLKALDMEPGDELYFYVKAQDTHRQESRTDVYTVTLQDTAELLSMDGILTGANLKPEFFRSERQIIIDAEKLIKDKDTISADKFNARSNDLGIDQKLLRLRYGKFLGEEDEAATDPRGADNLSDPADFSNATKILKEYTDDHDKAEDAQFFEPAIKAQLKATLTEMWKAELQLRLYKPQAALPFAYKALRLLKDLQQKSRSYVAKTAYNPPPLKPEKRLSGELDKIIQPTGKQDIKAAADQYLALKNTVIVLEKLKTEPATAADKHILQLGNQQLSAKASAQPGTYLAALNAMRRILAADKTNLNDIDLAERAIQKTLAAPVVKPSANQEQADMGLSRSYYNNLKKGRQ